MVAQGAAGSGAVPGLDRGDDAVMLFQRQLRVPPGQRDHRTRVVRLKPQATANEISAGGLY